MIGKTDIEESKKHRRFERWGATHSLPISLSFNLSIKPTNLFEFLFFYHVTIEFKNHKNVFTKKKESHLYV